MIRLMQETDLDTVAVIEAACIQQPWSRKSFAESLEKEYSLFLVAEEEEKVCAYIGLYLTYEDAEITGIAVLSEKRRGGIGKALLQQAVSYAEKKGARRILLEVRKSNVSAQAFYKKMGFEEMGIRPNFYDFPKEDAILMQLQIKE
jgi:[ribosomal protein S18]-alanine N-acetyltransferase